MKGRKGKEKKRKGRKGKGKEGMERKEKKRKGKERKAKKRREGKKEKERKGKERKERKDRKTVVMGRQKEKERICKESYTSGLENYVCIQTTNNQGFNDTSTSILLLCQFLLFSIKKLETCFYEPNLYIYQPVSETISRREICKNYQIHIFFLKRKPQS